MSQQNTVDANQAGQPGEQEEPVLTGVLADQSDVLLDENGDGHVGQRDAEEWEERESRNQLKHVAGLGELQDVTEVEYRKVRLERVVLVGVWSSAVTTQAKAEESLLSLIHI